MYRKIEKQLLNLKDPTGIHNKTLENFIDEAVNEAKSILSTAEVEWMPLEADPYMKNLRVLALRQLHNQAGNNLTILGSLLTTATGIDLDHIGTGLKLFRDPGEYPYADFKLSINSISNRDINIPAGMILNTEDDDLKAITTTAVVISAGSLDVTVRAELEVYIKESSLKTEKLLTDLTFALKIKQLTIFKNGAIAENDHRYRLRLIASKDRYSTAGSIEAYTFYTYAANSQVNDVSIPLDNKPLDVDIYISSFTGVNNEMIKDVYESCSAEYVRPLGDNLNVYAAKEINVNLTADIQLFNLLDQSKIDEEIKANLNNSFFIGQDFVNSDFIRKCHINGVYKVVSDFTDIAANAKEIIKIKSIQFNYLEARL